MNKKTLDKIQKFRGDIQSAFIFLMDVYDDLEFKIQTNLRAISEPYDTFGNAIRSYRQKGLIHPVEKLGVRLVLNGRNLIQYLLVQRFLFIGAKLNVLQEAMPNIADENLQFLILAESLSLSDLPIASTNSDKLIAPTSNTLISELPVSFTLKVLKGVHLVIDANQYSVDEAKQMLKVVKNALAGSDYSYGNC